MHKHFLQTLQQYLSGIPVSEEDLERAKSHVVDCPSCWEALIQFSDTLAPMALENTMIQEAPPFPTGPTFAQARRIHSESSAFAPLSGIWQRRKDYLICLSPDLIIQELLIFLDALASPPAVAMAHRGEGKANANVGNIDITEGENLQASIVAESVQEGLVDLLIEISMPERWPDYSGVRVILDLGTEEREQITSESGRISFHSLPLDELGSARLHIFPPEGQN